MSTATVESAPLRVSMPTPSYPVVPGTPGLVESIQALAPVSGTCIFIDVTGSTAMKNTRTAAQWIILLSNCFGDAKDGLRPFPLLKTIGDELMYFIEDKDLVAEGYNHFQIYDALWQIAVQESSNYPDVKISAAWCDDVYPVTFIPGQQDYYGLGIDLTARLMKHATTKQVVIDSRLHERVMQGVTPTGTSAQHASIASLRGPQKVQPVGIASPVQIFVGS